jgi:hypothetical protein
MKNLDLIRVINILMTDEYEPPLLDIQEDGSLDIYGASPKNLDAEQIKFLKNVGCILYPDSTSVTIPADKME